MHSKPAKEVEKKRRKPPAYGAISLWATSLVVWLGVFQFPWPARLALAYGSFLLWAVSSSFIWGRKAPFLAVVFFLLGSWLLHDDAHPLTSDFALWVLLVFVSSLCSAIWVSAHQDVQKAREREKEQSETLLHVARLSSLGRMTASICHDMKNQIAVIVGYLDQLKEEPDIAEAHRRKIDRSLLATDNMLKILTQLRSLGRDTLNDPLKPLALNLIILDSINFLDRHIIFHGIGMDLQLANNLPPALGDAVQMQTIFINLLHDSMEAFKGQKTPSGASKRIHLATTEHEGSIRIRYSDNGVRSSAPQGFDRLVVEDLVKRQGGTLVYGPTLQAGWDVTITLPRATAAAQVTDNDDILAASGL